MSWSLRQVTPPAAEPVSLAEAKAWLRLDTDDDDPTVAFLLGAARDAVANRVRRALIRATWDLTLDGFPDCWRRPLIDGRMPETPAGWFPGETAIVVPLPPLASVTSISYTAADGSSTTLGPSAYKVTGADPGRITPAYGRSWPTARAEAGSVVVRFVAGYGTTAADVPPAIGLAIRVLVALYYEKREEPGAVPDGVDAILDAVRWK